MAKHVLSVKRTRRCSLRDPSIDSRSLSRPTAAHQYERWPDELRRIQVPFRKLNGLTDGAWMNWLEWGDRFPDLEQRSYCQIDRPLYRSDAPIFLLRAAQPDQAGPVSTARPFERQEPCEHALATHCVAQKADQMTDTLEPPKELRRP